MDCKSNLKVILLVLCLITILLIIPSVLAIDWSIDMRITWHTSDDWYPSLTQASDGKIWFVWHSQRVGLGEYEIFYKYYDPSKTNPWSSDMRLTQSSGLDLEPSIMQALDNRIWVVWTTKRTGNFEIYYMIYDGASWSPDTKLPADPELPDSGQFPAITQTLDGTIWIFWNSKRTGNREIFYKTSSDNGASWSPDTLLNAISSPADDWDPAVTLASDGKIWLVWTKNDDVYYTFYNGVSWSSGASVTISGGFDWHPSIAQDAEGKIWVVWDSDRIAPLNDIYYNIFDGVSWLGDTQLTTDLGDDDMPSIMRATDGTMWVAWTSFRVNNRDIYYRTNTLSPPHDVAIFSVTPSASIVTKGKKVAIEVVAQNHGAENETFSIQLYANTILIGSKQIINLQYGQLYPTTFNWDTTDFTPGTYNIMANTSIVAGETNTADNTYIDGTVMVVIHDVAVISVTPSATIVYKGISDPYVTVNVEVKNKGTILEEDVTVTAYYGSNIIGIMTVPIEPGATINLWFFLDTTSVQKGGYYQISAEASAVLDEVNQRDNYLADGTILLTILGDVTGDAFVNLADWSTISAHWYPGPPPGPLDYDAFVDINGDGAINILEVSIVSSHWGETW